VWDSGQSLLTGGRWLEVVVNTDLTVLTKIFFALGFNVPELNLLFRYSKYALLTFLKNLVGNGGTR
jgi:hypothetical protein